MARREAKPPRVYLLWGQEEVRKRQALETLIAELVPAEDRELDVQQIDATNAGVTGESILHAARDRAMFSERRVVVVLNAGRLRGNRHQRTQTVLAEGVKRLPDYSTLIFVAGAEEGDDRRARSPFGEELTAAIRSAGQVKQFALLKPEELAQLAAAEAAELGKKLAPAAAALLANRAGPDTNAVLQETRKLAAYVGDRATISPADVTLLVPEPPDDNIFHMLEAAMSGDRRRALDLLRQLRQGGTASAQVQAMLLRTLRQAAQGKYLAEHRVPPEAPVEAVPPEVRAVLPEEGTVYRGTSDWQRKRIWAQGRRFSWGALQFALDRLAVVDAGSKGWDRGIEDADLALELFIVSLSDRLQAAPGRT
jgi:DNA polymerase-3 subunit delta